MIIFVRYFYRKSAGAFGPLQIRPQAGAAARQSRFQPCNLALRNAWVSGGVEWNVGIIGHTPFTVDAMFAENWLSMTVLRFCGYSNTSGYADSSTGWRQCSLRIPGTCLYGCGSITHWTRIRPSTGGAI